MPGTGEGRERRRPQGTTSPSIRVLLAQDCPSDTRTVCQHLEHDLGAQVTISRVASLCDAAALVQARTFDVVLLDVALPDLDGFDDLDQFCEIDPRPPLIVLSGTCDEALAAHAMRRGAQDYLPMDQLYPSVLSRMIIHAMERHRYEQRLREVANFDSLTGLANRYSFLQRTEQAIAGLAKSETNLALLFMDVDRLKAVNDGFGHAAGDQVLCEVARRIENVLRLDDGVSLLSTAKPTAARLGGDEFAVLLEGVTDRAALHSITERLSLALSRSVHVAGHVFTASTSIGEALYPEDGTTAEALLRTADEAMYRAKRRGWMTVEHRRGNEDEARARVHLESDLRGALSRGELVVHYQPQVVLRTGDIVGVEALLRWRRRSGELSLPQDFLEVLNETGLIIDAGRWVLSTACDQIRSRDHGATGSTALRIAVNVSPYQLYGEDFVDQVKAALERTSLAPDLLEIEIVEDALLSSRASWVLSQLSALGVRIALDDFGSGYSSIARLRDLPVDTLKLDRSFVHDVENSPRSAELVHGVIDMAKRLEIEVVAEGVERAGQLQALVDAGCEIGQGFLLGKPLAQLPGRSRITV